MSKVTQAQLKACAKLVVKYYGKTLEMLADE